MGDLQEDLIRLAEAWESRVHGGSGAGKRSTYRTCASELRCLARHPAPSPSVSRDEALEDARSTPPNGPFCDAPSIHGASHVCARTPGHSGEHVSVYGDGTLLDRWCAEPVVRQDWTCEAGTKACPGTQGSLAKDWICTACGRKAHPPKTWRDKGLTEKPKTYEPPAPVPAAEYTARPRSEAESGRSPMGRDGWTAEDDAAEDAWARKPIPPGGCTVCKGTGSRPLRSDAGTICGSIFCGPCAGSGRAPVPAESATKEET